MPAATAETLKDILTKAINEHMLKTGQNKTETLTYIKSHLKTFQIQVSVRQLYKWLNKDAFPTNADNIITSLDALGTRRTPERAVATPATASQVTLPFRVIIAKDTLKVSDDGHGNIILRGLLSAEIKNGT